MSKYNVVDNTELVELIECGLRKGYWDKALIPELKKRFKALEKKEQLLELYKELEQLNNDFFFNRLPIDKYVFKNVEIYGKIKELEK